MTSVYTWFSFRVMERGGHLLFPAAEQSDHAAQRIILDHLDVGQHDVDVHAEFAGDGGDHVLAHAVLMEGQADELLVGGGFDQRAPPR